MQASLVRTSGRGLPDADRGATNDSRVLGQGSHYYLLGPESPTIRRPSEMPGIIGEALFLTSPEDAQAIRQDKVLEAVARGYFDAIRAYFEVPAEVAGASLPQKLSTGRSSREISPQLSPLRAMGRRTARHGTDPLRGSPAARRGGGRWALRPR